jgi:hypothetical protein
VKANNVGALEALFSQGRGDVVEITFNNDERCFVATLLEDYDPDEELEEELAELEDEVGENEALGPGPYELVEYDDEVDDTSQHLRELVRASGATMVEALLELEIAYRNFLGIR